MEYINLNTAPNHIKLTSSYITPERISYNDKHASGIRKNIKRKCANGDVYDGEIDSGSGKFDGNGKMVFTNKDEYLGEWRGGKMNGRGKIIFHDGGYFDGIFNEGLPVNGLYERGDGIVYQGEVAQNYTPSGNGKMTYPNYCEEEGNFENGILLDGKRYYYQSHIEESGLFKNGILLNGVKDFYNPGRINAFEQAKLKLQGVERRIEDGEFLVNGELLNGSIKNGDSYIVIRNSEMCDGKCMNFVHHNNIYNGEVTDGIFIGSVSDMRKQNVFNGTMRNGMQINGNGTSVSASSLYNDNMQPQMPITQIYNGKWKDGKFDGVLTSYTADGIYTSNTDIDKGGPQKSTLYAQGREMYNLSSYCKDVTGRYHATNINESDFATKNWQSEEKYPGQGNKIMIG
jgi:hypothetical protein